MNVLVYAICKNESALVERWLAAIGDALVYVVDTGSTDGTQEILRKYDNVICVDAKIDPWRFDVARNTALRLLPDVDVCVSMDLDDVICSEWRERLEHDWVLGCSRLSYTYNHSHEKFFVRDCIHRRDGFFWKYPCHEVLLSDSAVMTFKSSITVDHRPDPGKSRADYLPLLELGAHENPDDPWILYNLGVAYYSRLMYGKARGVLERAFKLEQWRPRLASIAIYFSRMAETRKDRVGYARMACEIFPEQREPWLCLAEALIASEEWLDALVVLRTCVKITSRAPLSVVEGRSWSELPAKLTMACKRRLGR